MAISIKHAKLSTELGVGEKFDDSEWDAEHDTSGIPDLAAANTFSANQTITPASGYAILYLHGPGGGAAYFQHTAAGSNLKRSRIVHEGGVLHFQLLNDDGSTKKTPLVMNADGTSTFATAVILDGDFYQYDAEPIFLMQDNDGPTNKKRFVSFPRDGTWQMEAQNDAGGYLRTLFGFAHDGGFTVYGGEIALDRTGDAAFRAKGTTAGKLFFEVTSAGANLKKHSIHVDANGDMLFYNFNDDWSVKNYALQLFADGHVMAPSYMMVGPGSGTGYLRYQAGDSNTGWIGWYRASGLRTAYMGYMVTDHVLQMENGANFVIAPGSYTRIEAAYRDPLCVRAFQTGGVDFAQMTFWKDGIVATYWGFDETEQFELGANSWGRHRFACNSSGQLYGAEYGWLHDRFLRDHRVVYWGGTSSVSAGNELNARSYVGTGSAYVHSFQLTSYHYAWFSYHQALRHGTWYNVGWV